MELEVNTSIPVQFEMLENENDTRFCKVKVWVCHTGENKNGSYFSKEALEALKDSLANVPILGYIQVDEVNETDYKGHETAIEITDDNIKFKYQGRAYGLVPENNNAQFEVKICDDGIEREFLTCEALMWKKFPEAIDIIERDGAKGQSMELQRDSIKGQLKKDGLFYFDSALVEGLCLLGDDYIPAMTGASVELFSISNIKQQMQEMMTELKIFMQGGNEMVDNNEFTLTAEQLKAEIRNTLQEEKYVDDWGWESCRYWYIDHDENFIYAQDEKQGYSKIYSFKYTINGDAIVIDFDSQSRVKIVFEPFEGEDVGGEDFEFIALERAKGAINYKVQEAEKTIQEQFAEKEKELNVQIEEAKNNYTTLEQETEQLREYKENKIIQEHEDAIEAMFARFSNELNDEDIGDLKERACSMTVEELEVALFALVGKKKANFTAVENKPQNTIKLTTPPDKPIGGKSWGHLVKSTDN